MTEQVRWWVALALGLSGCASGVEVLRHDARGGELRLHGPAAPSAAEARLLMAEHCGGRYQLQTRAHAALEAANALALEGRVRFVCSRPTPDVTATDVLASAQTDAAAAR